MPVLPCTPGGTHQSRMSAWPPTLSAAPALTIRLTTLPTMPGQTLLPYSLHGLLRETRRLGPSNRKVNALAYVGLISLTLLPRRDTLPVLRQQCCSISWAQLFWLPCGELGGQVRRVYLWAADRDCIGCFLLPAFSAQTQHTVQTHSADLTAEPVAVEVLPCLFALPYTSNVVCSCKASSLSLSYSHSPLPPHPPIVTNETEYLKVFQAGLELRTLLSQLLHS